jgi:hypothetical protein
VKELVNASEIARRAGVSREAVSNWAQRHKDFPKPIKAADGVKHTLRDWAQVETWLAKHRAERRVPQYHVEAMTDLEHFKAAFRAQVKPDRPGDWPHISLIEKPEEDNRITIQMYETRDLGEGETRLDTFGAGFVFTPDGKFVGAYNWKE